jgi:5-methyltetrahydropteroyltriglutamate--homocysteine methyltransferase
MTNVPYHCEVVGSLLRPAYLLEARQQWETGQLSPADFKAIEDRAVNAAVALQEATGIDVITDGEMRRYTFYGHLVDALEGFDKFGGRAVPFRDETGEQLLHALPVVVERHKWRRNMCAEEWVYLRARKSRPGKMTMPDIFQSSAHYDPEKSKAAYPTQDAYLADIVDFTRREIQELIRLGCTYIQFDAPYYTALLAPQRREAFRQQGQDPDRMLAQGIEVENAVIDGYSGVTFALHLCRGNNQSKFSSSGDYGPISQLFSRTHFDRFLLEYDDERSGGFEPLRFVPDDRTVVLGLVSTKKAQLEEPEELRQRIKEATRYIPLERLALSPQCGFASTIEGNLISFEDQRRKLELVVNAAREVWES